MTGAARTADEEIEYALAALDVMTDAFLVVAPDLTVLVCNLACAQALGGRPASVTAVELAAAGTEVLHPDGDAWPQEDWAITRAVRDGVTTTGQLMDLRRDGAVVRVSVSAAPLHRPGEDRPYAAFAVYGDATPAQTAALALAESEAHFRLLAENSTDVITRHSADGTCLYASPALLDLVGRDPATLTGRRVPDFVHPEDLPALTEATIRLFRAGEISVVRYRTAHVDGRWVWVETVMRPVRADDRVLELQSSTRDITARVEAEQRLARLALSDPLTGLSNRAALQQHLEDLLAGDQPLSLLFLDLDRFKLVNDSLGHSAGDELLRTVSARLSGTCRDGDLVARLGGDEFVMVAAGLDETGALLLADRVQHVLGLPVEVAGHELVVSVSVGIVTSGRGSRRDAEALLRDADVSMYEAKAGGRARAVLWSASTGQSAVARLTLERELRAALAGGQLVVHHQPQVELAGRRVVGVEALVRWQHPTRGLLPPAAFLEVAEDTGLIVELGRQVLRSAAAQVAAWRRLPGCEDLTLSVNASTRELLDPGRFELVLQVLGETGLPASALTVEVLEGVLLDPAGAVVTALAAYARHGIRLALDDFGTGSSSLLHLRHVPVSTVKIDRTFVAGLGRSRQDEAIVRALLTLTGDLGLACVAEGVEDAVQYDWLVAQSVRVAQGHALHRPMPASQVDALLRVASQQLAVGTAPRG